MAERKDSNANPKKHYEHHGHAASNHSRTYASWLNIKKRCFNQSYEHYDRYGGRGITVCKRWKNSFKAFLEDMGPRPSGMTLDRINNDGNYKPGNCRWATHQTQTRNTHHNVWITHNGERMLLKELAERTGEPYKRMWRRLKNGSPLLGPRIRRWYKKPKEV